jgi:hypothetical protein
MKENVCWLVILILIFLVVARLSMWLFAGRTEAVQSPSGDKPQTAEEFCVELIMGFKKKATSNKNESMIWFFITMASSLVAPIFVTLGGGSFFWGKFLPSLLSAIVAFGAAWMQLRKPQHLWALYRGCQRRLEDNLTKYRFKVEDYDGVNADKILAQRCADIAISAHNEWLPIMPKGDNYSGSSSKEK